MEWLLAAHQQPCHTKRYSKLDPKRKKQRVALLKRLALWVSCDECLEEIIRDACGDKSAAMESVVGAFNRMSPRDCTSHASFACKLMLLQPVCHRAPTAVAKLGFKGVGAGLLSAARSFAESNAQIPPAPSPGRPQASKEALEKAWVSVSSQSSMTDRSDNPIRVIFGAKKDAARKVAEQAGVSQSTAVKYCSAKPAKRGVDYCDFCERLRRLRLAALRKSGGVSGDTDGLGQAYVKAAFEKMGGVRDHLTAPAAKDVAVLEKHEAQAAKIRAEFADAWKNGAKGDAMVVVADFGGSVELSSQRGASAEFFSKAVVSPLCVCVRLGTGFQPVDVYDLDFRHGRTGVDAAGLFLLGLRSASKCWGKDRGAAPKSLEVWLDAGKNFRCGSFLWEILLGAHTESYTSITVNFFAEGHGKSVCDGHMAVLKKKLKLVDMGAAPSLRHGVVEATHGANAIPVFAGRWLPSTHTPMSLCVPYITAHHSFHRNMDGDLFVSGRQHKRKHAPAVERDAAGPQKRSACKGDPVGRARKKQRLEALATFAQ